MKARRRSCWNELTRGQQQQRGENQIIIIVSRKGMSSQGRQEIWRGMLGRDIGFSNDIFTLNSGTNVHLKDLYRTLTKASSEEKKNCDQSRFGGWWRSGVVGENEEPVIRQEYYLGRGVVP